MFLILLLLIAAPFSSNRNAACAAPQWSYKSWRPARGMATTTAPATQTENLLNVKRKNSYDSYEWDLSKQSTGGTGASVIDYSNPEVTSINWWERNIPNAPWTKSTRTPSTASTSRSAMSEKVVTKPLMEPRLRTTGPVKAQSDALEEYYAWEYSTPTTIEDGMKSPGSQEVDATIPEELEGIEILLKKNMTKRKGPKSKEKEPFELEKAKLDDRSNPQFYPYTYDDNPKHFGTVLPPDFVPSGLPHIHDDLPGLQDNSTEPQTHPPGTQEIPPGSENNPPGDGDNPSTYDVNEEYLFTEFSTDVLPSGLPESNDYPPGNQVLPPGSQEHPLPGSMTSFPDDGDNPSIYDADGSLESQTYLPESQTDPQRPQGFPPGFKNNSLDYEGNPFVPTYDAPSVHYVTVLPSDVSPVSSPESLDYSPTNQVLSPSEYYFPEEGSTVYEESEEYTTESMYQEDGRFTATESNGNSTEYQGDLKNTSTNGPNVDRPPETPINQKEVEYVYSTGSNVSEFYDFPNILNKTNIQFGPFYQHVPVANSTLVSVTPMTRWTLGEHHWWATTEGVDYLGVLDQLQYSDLNMGSNHSQPITELEGLTSSPPNKSQGLVSDLYNYMDVDQSGFFSAFIVKFFKLITEKNVNDASDLFQSIDTVMNEMDDMGTLEFLGHPFRSVIMNNPLSAMDTDTTMSTIKSISQKLQDRRQLANPDTNTIIDILDYMYQRHEGKALFASLVLLMEYPENHRAPRDVINAVLTAVMLPFFRLRGHEELDSILDLMNNVIVDHFSQKTSLRNDVIAFTKETRRKYGKNKIQYIGRNRKQSKRIEHEKTRNAKITNNSFRNKKKRNKRKTKRLSIETGKSDRDFTPYKHKHKMVDFKKHVKYKIKRHLKNKHRVLYENYRSKHKQAKKLTQIQNNQLTNRFNEAHKYEKLLWNKYQNSEGSVSTSRNWTIVTPKVLQKRFSIVNALRISNEWIESTIKNTKSNAELTSASTQGEETKRKTQPSNHLFRQNLRFEKQKRMDNKILKDSSFSDEESELKYNLDDTLRHGDRKFINRNVYNARKSLHDLSSYSDEEMVLKNNIYKVFGHTLVT